MTTINLQQDQQREKMINGAGKLSSNLVFFLVVCCVLVVIFAGLKIGNILIQKKDAEVKNEIKVANQSLNEKKGVDELIDLQARIREVNNNLTEKLEVNDALDSLSKTIIPGVVFSYYNNSDRKILVVLKSSNFDTISKQIFNFKQADFISDVNVSRLSRNENGIECAVEMKIK